VFRRRYKIYKSGIRDQVFFDMASSTAMESIGEAQVAENFAASARHRFTDMTAGKGLRLDNDRLMPSRTRNIAVGEPPRPHLLLEHQFS
jgi:hypothetical protein